VFGDKMTRMKKLKILVVEYITGGGFSQSVLPEQLAIEGLMMLQALIGNLEQQAGCIDYSILLDSRLMARMPTMPRNSHLIKPGQDFGQVFQGLLATCDAVWPIAPESEGILFELCEQVAAAGKILLTSPATAVAITGNKWLTYQQLAQHEIKTVATYRLDRFNFMPGEWIVKPIDGVGCEHSFLVSTEPEYEAATARLQLEGYIIQPHIDGEKTSLSALFKQGEGWLLCANQQHFERVAKQYHLVGITVNYTADLCRYQTLVDAIAKAFPDLWGYAGIDLIETSGQTFVLEINPRLTTSLVGIQEACGINCAQKVLDLLAGNPTLQPTRNNPVYVSIKP
jgi:tyramine---L-glutamate ligase